MTTFYRKGTKLQQEEYNIVLHQGGLGDLIGQLPAINYILKHQQHIKINLYVHEYGVELCKKVFIEYPLQLNVFSISAINNKYNNDLPTRSPYLHKVNNLSSSIVDNGFATIVGKQLKDGDPDKNYLKLETIDIAKFNLPKTYAVVTTGFTSNTREFLPKHVNDVSDYLNSINITPIYIGKKYTRAGLMIDREEGIKGNFNADYSKGINLIDSTDLFEAHSIMANAVCVLGVDNGLLHLAAMSDVPIIAGFTSVDPIHRTPQRYNILGWNFYSVYPTKEELRCIGCQSNMSFAKHKFIECYYGDYTCLNLLTIEKWKEQICKIIT